MIAVALPQPAYRLTWLAKRLDYLSHNLVFESLLRQISPQAFAALRPNRGDMEAYNLLVSYIEEHLFPVWTGVEFGWAEEEEEIDQVGEALYYGIPVETFGYDRDEVSDERCSPAIALMYICAHLGNDRLEDARSLKRYLPALAGLLNTLATQPGGAAKTLVKNVHPSRGRAWRSPWDALPDMLDYMTGNVGNPFLDYSHQDIAEMDGNPPWHIEEIRGLAEYWTQAKPIWTRIQKLRDYIDAAPARRLPQLLEVLTGHERTRQHLSRPKTHKTLMDILK